LILFVNPDKERFLFVVVDATSLGPFAVEIAGFKESITLFEKEMVLDKLVSVSIAKSVKSIEFSL
jgi:hypothetical protein